MLPGRTTRTVFSIAVMAIACATLAWRANVAHAARVGASSPRAVIVKSTMRVITPAFIGKRPVPLTRTQITMALKELNQPQTGGSAPASFALSALQPFIADKGSIIVNDSYSYWPENSVVGWKSTGAGMLFVKLNHLASDHRYLVDFSVYYDDLNHSEPGAVFLLNKQSPSPQSFGAEGGPQHLLFVINTPTPSDAFLSLTMKNATRDWAFYQVDVTPL